MIVMGDSAKQKTIHCLSEPSSTVHTRGSGLWSRSCWTSHVHLDVHGPVHRSHDRPARITTELLITFAEASSDIDVNVSHDAILRHSDARIAKALAVVLNRNFSLRFGSVNQFESIFPSLCA